MRFKDDIPYVLEIIQNPSIGEENCGYVRSCDREDAARGGLESLHRLGGR